MLENPYFGLGIIFVISGLILILEYHSLGVI